MKQSGIARARMRIRQIERGIELIKMLPDGPFDFPVEILCNDKIPTVRLPFDLEAFKVYRKAMVGNWQCKEWTDTQHEDCIVRHRMYWPKGSNPWRDGYVQVCLDTRLDKSVCKVRQVDTREVPVFEIVCT